MRWIVRFAALLAIVLPAVAIYAILEPVAGFGYDRDALAQSLEGEAPSSLGAARCAATGPRWHCVLEPDDPRTSSGGRYLLRADDDGCWKARRIVDRPQGRTTSGESLEGCVDLLDIIGIDILS